VSDGDNKQLSL